MQDNNTTQNGAISSIGLENGNQFDHCYSLAKLLLMQEMAQQPSLVEVYANVGAFLKCKVISVYYQLQRMVGVAVIL